MIKPRYLNSLLLLAILVLIAFATLSGLSKFTAVETASGIKDMRWLVLADIRYPRIMLALLTGAGLAITGNAMQGLFQNPLASPGLLGSASGATTMSVLLLYYFSASIALLIAGGVLGALASFLLVYAIAGRHGTTMMILAGVAVNALLAAVITLLLSNAESPWALAELYRWLQGSLAMAAFSDILMVAPLLLLAVMILFQQRHFIDKLTFGQDSAATMGINPKRAFLLTAIAVALVIGCLIPQTGVIGFIGLIAPHLARMLLKKRPSQLYLSSGLLGALLLLVADLLVWRVDFFQGVHIGTLTSIIGAPFLVWILWQQRQVD